MKDGIQISTNTLDGFRRLMTLLTSATKIEAAFIKPK
jgi:hypothetical protein